ncbi:peptide-methionine (S)-S-oxide reductase MsrA [Nitratireductor thuwali]|uniref:Peptide methionine sulfoxide reductase MsrA n=1 Tax=Nitratireductor thuwali TaxID=2267699 RepID=A0ABY5MLG6_9HYPH|nr:Peptide methionine sulfoxide reductase MsrA 2 [Nitratireductor thuwali]
MKRLIIAALALAVTALGAGMTGAAAATRTALFAGGCFWCVEADFDKVPGVVSTVSGYAGGRTANPTYRNYASGGHREVVKIEYDDSRVSYERLLEIFFRSVDPTDPGGQFCDRGKSYSTAVYALDAAQKKAAEKAKQEAANELGQPVVTPILPAAKFWAAEDYHQNYYRSNDRILTRFGYITKAKAYEGYREGCGRDARVRQLWGEAAYTGIRK